MSERERPLILITNDDGIRSQGLLAAAQACAQIGRVLVVAPAVQQTASGRSKPAHSSGRITPTPLQLEPGTPPITAYAVDASPAQAVEYALFELTEEPVALAVSGINYGENIGEGVTVSGTIGAAMEAASFGIPALAFSRQTAAEHYLSPDGVLDFSTAGYFVRRFAEVALRYGLPQGADLLKIDVPETATVETPRRWTRVSRRRYFHPVPPQRRSFEEVARMGFVTRIDAQTLEPDSDIRAVMIDRVISVTPLCTDLTAPCVPPGVQTTAKADDGQGYATLISSSEPAP